MGSVSFRWASRNARALDRRNVRSSLGFNSSSARVWSCVDRKFPARDARDSSTYFGAPPAFS
jgi:hypothetical protein